MEQANGFRRQISAPTLQLTLRKSQELLTEPERNRAGRELSTTIVQAKMRAVVVPDPECAVQDFTGRDAKCTQSVTSIEAVSGTFRLSQ